VVFSPELLEFLKFIIDSENGYHAEFVRSQTLMAAIANKHRNSLTAALDRLRVVAISTTGPGLRIDRD